MERNLNQDTLLPSHPNFHTFPTNATVLIPQAFMLLTCYLLDSYYGNYADDVNLLGKNITITKRNVKALLEASRNVGVQVNTEKTKYMFISHQKMVKIILR